MRKPSNLVKVTEKNMRIVGEIYGSNKGSPKQLRMTLSKQQ
jgi:hypothetical protein